MPLIHLLAVCGLAASSLLSAAEEARWYKGNLHTHTYWSDGDDFPEMVADWYKSRGYDFLALSDHNIIADHEKWLKVNKSKTGAVALDKYLKRFGKEWVIVRGEGEQKEVRLRTLAEMKPKLEEPGKFLMIPSEEITDKNVHVNATNIQELILPDKSLDTTTSPQIIKALQHAFDAVHAQRVRTGVPMFAHLNHPNFKWAITAEELMRIDHEQFFEVYNGHPSVNNDGDELHAGTERVWDIVLAERLGHLGKPVMYGLATDDSHHYHSTSPKSSLSGRGWVMVKAKELSADALVAAMELGDFYSSSGVTFKTLQVGAGRIALEIKAEAGVEYVIDFIGTRKGYDRKTVAVKAADGSEPRVTRRYSAEVGVVLASAKGTKAEYILKGDELYVRARVTSSKPMQSSPVGGEVEKAWTQPVVR
ncbi:MAG: hypothetical protein RJB43_1322 [Verrucomicrobiota bacterium]|jgi:hypothetical protein